MEYITGRISLFILFRLYWANYGKWYTGNIREVVYENVNKILKCRTSLLGFHMYKCMQCSRVRLMPLLPEKGLKKQFRYYVLNSKKNTKVKEQVQNEDIKTLALASALAFYKLRLDILHIKKVIL